MAEDDADGRADQPKFYEGHECLTFERRAGGRDWQRLVLAAAESVGDEPAPPAGAGLSGSTVALVVALVALLGVLLGTRLRPHLALAGRPLEHLAKARVAFKRPDDSELLVE